MHESEHKLSQVFESITDAFVALDQDWRFVHSNLAASRLFHIPADQFLGRNIWEAIPELEETPCHSELVQCQHLLKPRSFEFFFEPNDAWYECHCYPSDELLSVIFVDITRWKQQELMSESTGARVAHAVAEAQGGFWDMQIPSRDKLLFPERCYFSPNLKQFLGFSDAELPNSLSAWFDLIHPDDLPRLKQAMQEHLSKDSGRFEFEYRIRANDGSYRWFYSRGNALSQPESDRLRWLAVTLDVTEKKNQEEHRARLAAIVESSQDAIISETLDGTITTWNPGAERLYDYRAEEMIGKSLYEVLVPEDRKPELQEAIRRVSNEEIFKPFQTQRLHRCGRPLEVLLTLSPIRNEIGTIIGISAIHSDITQSKRIERELRQLNQTLISVLRAFPDIVWVLGKDGEVQFLNPAAERFFQTRGSDETLPDGVVEVIEQARKTGNDHVPADFRGVHEIKINGDTRYYLCRIMTMKDGQGELFGLTVMLQDVTNFRLLDEIKTNLIGTVSHELKTPVTSIRMSLLLLLKEQVGKLNEDQRELASIARDEVERLLKTLNTLLDLTRFEEGQQAIQPRRTQVRSLMDTVVSEVKATADTTRIEIEPVIAESIPDIEVDYDRIVHALTNLLTNAIKHSPEGSMVKFEVRMHDAKHMRFSVADQGPGVPKEFQLRIFDKFFKTPGNTKGGSGLGLSIVKQFVRAHGGTTGVHSEPPNGSEFFVILPLDCPSV